MPRLDVQFARSASGELVAECELPDPAPPLVEALLSRAREAQAARVWVHSAGDLGPFGLTRAEGYRRFTGVAAGAGEPLPVVPCEVVRAVLPCLYAGQWGHREPNAEWAEASDAVWVGLERGGAWAGLCRTEPAARYVDGPGALVAFRSASTTATLLRGAFSVLGDGPVTVESWGDPVDGYLAAGLTLAEEVPGWELVL